MRSSTGPNTASSDREITDAEAERVADGLIGPPVDSPTSRAYAQRSLADAIRRVPGSDAHCERRRILLRDPISLAALAATAHDDAIWDALAQVRQVVLLSRAPADESAQEASHGR